MTIFPSGKIVSVTREVFRPTKDTPIKPSLLLLTNAKDNEIIDLSRDHFSSIEMSPLTSLRCFTRPTGN